MKPKTEKPECRFEFCINSLGGLMLKCKIHGEMEGKYLQKKCAINLLKKLEGIEL